MSARARLLTTLGAFVLAVAAYSLLAVAPAGLSSSLRSIYQKELALKVPVILYVSPNGARAASAGVWIAEAGDVLALSPVSNIGSSTPINSGGGNIGSDLRRSPRHCAGAMRTSADGRVSSGGPAESCCFEPCRSACPRCLRYRYPAAAP